jgi:octaprenyl-diphosphate synthase
MNNINEIKKTIKDDLNIFESLLYQYINTNDNILKDKIDYLFSSKGKRIRPILVYLCSRVFGEPNSKTNNASLIIEILHTATLVHDDVVDNSSLRRGKESVNEKWDNKTAVLIGDYLFAKCIELLADPKSNGLLNIISPILLDLSYGELQQLNFNKKPVCSIDEYLEIIDKKTSSLISASCICGAYSTNASSDDIQTISDFGKSAGRIFQITDDIIDYLKPDETGKSYLNDLIEHKMTLPFILALENATIIDKERILNIWIQKDQIANNLHEIESFVKKNKGIDSAKLFINKEKLKAKESLKSLSQNKYTYALEKLIDFISDRKN